MVDVTWLVDVLGLGEGWELDEVLLEPLDDVVPVGSGVVVVVPLVDGGVDAQPATSSAVTATNARSLIVGVGALHPHELVGIGHPLAGAGLDTHFEG